MRFRNPNFVSPTQAIINARRGAVQAAINAARKDAEFLTLDDIRASFPAEVRGELKDGILHAILQDLGHQVEG